jgi:monoamine oxidase
VHTLRELFTDGLYAGAGAMRIPGTHEARDAGGRVHFAREHASLAHAWIQGAIESGLRAAWEIGVGP